MEDYDIMRQMLVQALSYEGHTVSRQYRKFGNVTALFKIIAISGGDRSFDGTTYLEIVKKSRADKTFVKPFDRREFIATVTMLLEPSE